MAMTIELKPCPFCGGEVQLDHPTDPRAKNITFILCDGCGAVTSFRPNLSGSKAAEAWSRRDCIYDAMADAIDAHLSQPAQAVDVVAWRWRDDVRPGLPWRTTTDAEVIAQMQASGGYDIEPLTRALSAEKAGWRDMDSAPKDGTDILATDGTAMLVTYWYGGSVGWLYSYSDHDVAGWHPTHWMPLPASPTPDKEG